MSVAVGFRAKTGRAIAVALADGAQPKFVSRQEISLVDPRMPETAQPYHEVMELPWDEAERKASRFERAIAEPPR